MRTTSSGNRNGYGRVGGKEDINGLQEELADVLICVDLNAMDLGIDCRSGEDVCQIRTGHRNLTTSLPFDSYQLHESAGDIPVLYIQIPVVVPV